MKMCMMWEKGGWRACCTLCVEVCATEGCVLTRIVYTAGKKVCTVHCQEGCAMGEVCIVQLVNTRKFRCWVRENMLVAVQASLLIAYSEYNTSLTYHSKQQCIAIEFLCH